MASRGWDSVVFYVHALYMVQFVKVMINIKRGCGLEGSSKEKNYKVERMWVLKLGTPKYEYPFLTRRQTSRKHSHLGPMVNMDAKNIYRSILTSILCFHALLGPCTIRAQHNPIYHKKELKRKCTLNLVRSDKYDIVKLLYIRIARYVMKIRYYVRIVRWNRRGYGLEGVRAHPLNTSKIYT